MGKTIMVSALIHTARVDEEDDDDMTKEDSGVPRQQQVTIDKAFRPVYRNKRRKHTPRTTLILAPTSLISQWASELRRSSQKGSLNVIVWHGTGRLDLQGEVDTGVDVVVTSYGVLASEYGRQVNGKAYKSPVHQSKSQVLSKVRTLTGADAHPASRMASHWSGFLLRFIHLEAHDALSL
jgi:DNA repair protein RAD5